MKKSETAKVLQILQTAYPHIYKMGNTEQAQQTVDLYFSMFQEYSIDIVLVALKNYIRTNKEFPSIAGIQEQINLLSGEQSPAELWTALEKAIGRSGYNYVYEFNNLPDAVQRWLGEPITLYKLSQQDLSTTQSVTRGQFLKTIEGIQTKQKALQALPKSLKDEIKHLGNKMGM